MTPARILSDNVIELKQANVLWRRLGGFALTFLGIGGIWVVIRDPEVVNRWLFALTSTALAIGGGYILGYVSHIRIDRAAGTVTKAWGWLRSTTQSTKRVEPTAIRITVNRSGIGEGRHTVNRLILVHTKGEIELWCSTMALDQMRTAAATLAKFLSVERYEDRLHKLAGAFVHQRGPGVEPTRTYVDRGYAEPLAADVETDENTLELTALQDDAW